MNTQPRECPEILVGRARLDMMPTLAAEIAKQAAYDYIRALKKNDTKEAEDIRGYFHSWMFTWFLTLDPDQFLQMVEQDRLGAA